MNRPDSSDKPPASRRGPGNGDHDASTAGPPADAAAPVDSSPTVFGWTRGDRQIVLSAGAAILLLLVVHWGRLAWRGQAVVEIQRLDAAANGFQLDINTATWVEWMQLEGVGEALSRRIVEDREQNGPFASVDEIQRVRGIGPATLEELRPWLCCADCPPSPEAIEEGER